MGDIAVLKSLPKFEMPKNFLHGVAQFSDGVKRLKEGVNDFVAIKDFMLTYNSKADEAFEAANPVPPAKSEDIKQIAYHGMRSVALSVELIQATGEFAKKRLSEQNG